MTTVNRTVWSDIVNSARGHVQGLEWSMNSTFSMILRRWHILLASVVVCTAMAVLIAMVMKPLYTADTLLQINTRTEQVSNVESVVGTLNTADPAIRTEIDVLTSRKLAARVVDKLGLLNEPQSTGFFGNLKNALGLIFLPMKEEEPTAEDRENRMSRAVSALSSRLEVSLTPRSYSIRVRYTSADPKRAAEIANAFAQEYLNTQLEDKFDATRRANDWMNDRLKQMQKSVQAAELASEKYREAHNLTAANGVLLSDQQLSELNSQLILARTKLAEEQAKSTQARRLQQSGGRGIESAAEVLNNPLITSLRQQETEVRREMAELASRYGERHPRMVTVRNQLGDLKRKIGEEVYKIQGSLENNVAVAEARVRTLQDQLETLQSKTSLTNDASVQLAELERQAMAERTLYESFLGRSKEIAQMSFVQSDARIISPAETPLSPSKPNKLLIVIMGVMAGAGLGVMLMVLLEMLDAGFRTSKQVENDLDEPVLGMLSELPAGEDLANYVINRPTSAFTEAIRAVRTAMQFAHPDKPAQVVVVSSSIPEEGKSMFAMSLAQLTANGGAKVLLIDGDLRRPSLSKSLKLKPTAGLAEVLIGKANLKDVLVTLPESKLTVLPSLPNAQFSQELLASQKMQDMLAQWRKQYDMIVIDSPPVMAVSDAITISSLCDSMLFVVRWGTTPRALASNAIKMLKTCHAPLTGCVVTRVDLDKQQGYSHGEYGYYYGKYKGYYTE